MVSSSSGWVRRFGINALSSLATRLLSVTVLVWVNQYLLRRIPPEEYSLFPLVMSLVVVSDFFVAILVGGISRHLVEAHHRDDPDGVTRVASSMTVVLVPAALVLALVGALAAWQIDALVEVAPAYLGQARVMLLLTTGTAAVMMATTPFALGLYVRERFVLENAIGLACEALRITLLLTLLFGAGTRVMWLVVASTSATLVNRVVQIGLSRRILPDARFEQLLASWTTTKTVLSFGAWSSVYWIRQLISVSAPVLLLNRFATPLDVATFHAGRLPEIHLRGLLQAVEGPSLPGLVGLYSREGKRAVDLLYFRGGRYYLWLIMLPLAPLFLFAEPLYVLYAGADYARAGLVAVALLACFPFQYASAMFYRVAHATGRIGAFHTYSLLVQLATAGAISYAVAVRGGGAVDAAVAIGATYVVLHVAMMWPMGLRFVQGRWSEFARQTLVRGLLPFGAATAACALTARLVRVESWWVLGAVSCGSLVVYLGVLVAFCLDGTDRELLGRGLRSLGVARSGRTGGEQV